MKCGQPSLNTISNLTDQGQDHGQGQSTHHPSGYRHDPWGVTDPDSAHHNAVFGQSGSSEARTRTSC